MGNFREYPIEISITLVMRFTIGMKCDKCLFRMMGGWAREIQQRKWTQQQQQKEIGSSSV